MTPIHIVKQWAFNSNPCIRATLFSVVLIYFILSVFIEFVTECVKDVSPSLTLNPSPLGARGGGRERAPRGGGSGPPWDPVLYSGRAGPRDRLQTASAAHTSPLPLLLLRALHPHCIHSFTPKVIHWALWILSSRVEPFCR